MNAAADIRVCFVGDSMVAGVGDSDHLGWVGRVAAQAAADGFELTAYNLGIRRETSADIAKRWSDECARRLPQGCQPHVVFSFGVNDTTEESGRTRVSARDSAENLKSILVEAKARYSVAMIGPPPISDAPQNQRTRSLCNQFGAICKALAVPYLPVFEALSANTIWMRQVAETDGAHPQAEGYMTFARLVTGWEHWWFQSAVS